MFHLCLQSKKIVRLHSNFDFFALAKISSLSNIEKQVIKKTKLSLRFCFIKNFLGTSKEPIRRVPEFLNPEGPGVHLVVVCMGLHESAVLSRD